MTESKRPSLKITPGGGFGGGKNFMNARASSEKPANTRKTLKRLSAYIGKSKMLLSVMLMLMLLITLIDILGPSFQQRAIDTISVSGDSVYVDFPHMVHYLIIMVMLFLVSAVLTYIQGILAARLSQSTVYSLRKELFDKFAHLPVRYIDTHAHGDLMSRMTNDADNVSNAVAQSITVFFQAILTLIGAFSMMLYYSPVLTLAAIVTIPITFFVSKILGNHMRKYFKEQQILLGRLNGHVEEMVTSYRTVVSYGKEDAAVSEFSETSEELRKYSIKARVWGSIMGPIMNFLSNFQYVLIAAVGGFLILSKVSTLTIGAIQAMLQYSKKFSQPINMIANQYSIILTALAGAERIFDVMDTEDEIDEGKQCLDVQSVCGDIEFEHLNFGYEKAHPVLKDFNLSVCHAQKIAIVGATGSGKNDSGQSADAIL
jgi:ATP-binding cassette subfamily B protein